MSASRGEITDALIAYTRAGVAVFPLHSVTAGRCTCGDPDCGNPGKHPRTKRGAHDASTDVGDIAEWMAQYGTAANWGGVPPTDVVVLDLDPRNGGDQALADLEAEHGKLPPTLTARTGGGGEHRWFTHRGRCRGKLADGIDVKTRSGYVVLPPSVHISGRRYTWIDQRPAEYAPTWLAGLLTPVIVPRTDRVYGGGDISGLIRFVSNATDGSRNRSLFWAACRCLEGGNDPEPLVRAAIAVGLSEIEASRTVWSAHRAVGRTEVST